MDGRVSCRHDQAEIRNLVTKYSQKIYNYTVRYVVEVPVYGFSGEVASRWVCNCPDFVFRKSGVWGSTCKHIVAVCKGLVAYNHTHMAPGSTRTMALAISPVVAARVGAMASRKVR